MVPHRIVLPPAGFVIAAWASPDGQAGEGLNGPVPDQNQPVVVPDTPEVRVQS